MQYNIIYVMDKTIESNMNAFKYLISDKFSTEAYEKICLETFKGKYSGWLLKHVDNNKISTQIYEEMCLNAFKKEYDYHVTSPLKYVICDYISKHIYEK